jgi:uncharacterized protein
MRRFWLAGAAVLTVTALAAVPQFPSLTGRVVDAANVLSSATEAELSHELAAFEAQSGDQLVVVTIPDLDGLDVADYGYQLGRAWGIGDKRSNTGALLIIAPNDRQVRIEVGYGLEGELTDAMAAHIIQSRILPAFRRGDIDAGARAGVAGIIEVLHGDAAPATDRLPLRKIVPGLLFWLFVLFIVLRSFGGPRRGGLARALFWGSVLSGMSHGGRGGGGFGGGGFSGGGGSFGGGGASGRW